MLNAPIKGFKDPITELLAILFKGKSQSAKLLWFVIDELHLKRQN